MQKINFNKIGRLILAICLIVFATGCSLDVTNPNSASEEQVLTTSDGIIALAIGMQQNYATSALASYILDTGVTSREIAINTTFANLIELEDGGTALSGQNANVTRLWSRSYRIIGMAEDLIDNAGNVQLDPGTRSGIFALAHLYKAMALGAVAQAFEQAPTGNVRRWQRSVCAAHPGAYRSNSAFEHSTVNDYSECAIE